LARACQILGVSCRTLQRWRRQPGGVDQRRGPISPPKHKLTDEEEERAVAVANSPEYRNLSPERVVARLADAGEYVCSESALRRILKRRSLAAHRQRSKPASPRHKPREYVAHEPLRVLTWDITYLRSAKVRGQFFYLYLFLDIWSRRIVGWAVHEIQSSDLAAQTLRRACEDNGIQTEKCVLHSDNGAPMKGCTMLATLADLGITRSFSRPSVSDDNAHVESLFRHLKYAPAYPSRGFDSAEHARRWVARFVRWYNSEHQHSSIGYVTPDDRHHGRDITLLEQRRELYERARKANPHRWTRPPRKWSRPAVVTLNPDRVIQTEPARVERVA
jgi:transposase InsO family protein